jgi:hypothetical protein
MRAMLAMMLIVGCVDDEPGNDDATICCALWPIESAIVSCVRERIENGCADVKCYLGFEAEVCTLED